MVYISTGRGSPGRDGNSNSNDFDRMCRELFWEVEQRLIMHKLAKDYYGFRSFWVQYVPLLLMSTFVTIIGFIQYGQYGNVNVIGVVNESDYAVAKQWLALSVGIIGLLSTILTSLIINKGYQSQRDMHAVAERTLSRVCQSVRFPERLMSGDDQASSIAENLNKQRAIYMSVSIASEIPPKIVHAFHDLGHIMDMKPYAFRAQNYELFYYFLWKLFIKRKKLGCFRLFPLRIPDIDVSTSLLGKMIDEEYEKFSQSSEGGGTRKSNLVLLDAGGNSTTRSTNGDDERTHASTARSTASSTNYVFEV